MHPSDATLRALLDGEAAPVMVADLEQHLEDCEVCRLSASAISRDRLAVRALLHSLDGTALHPSIGEVLQRAKRPHSRRGALIAALILLSMVTVAGAAIAPDLFQRVVNKLPWPRLAGPSQESVSQADGPISTGIALEAGDAAEIVFLSSQAAGMLTIMESDRTSVEVVATASVPYKVQRGKITITNEGTNADYQISIPRRLLQTEIRVADRVLFVKHGPAITAGVKPDSTGRYLLPFP